MKETNIELLKLAQSLLENNLFRELEMHNYNCQMEQQALPYPDVSITVDDVVKTAKELENKYINSTVQSLRG
jgi:hypothetical protein